MRAPTHHGHVTLGPLGPGDRVQIDRIAVEPAEIACEYGGNTVFVRSVILAQPGMILEVVRHGHAVLDLVRGHALVHPSEGLIVQILDGIAVIDQHVVDGAGAFHRAAVVRDQHLGAEPTQPLDAVGPDHRIAETGAAQGIDIGKCFALHGVAGQQHLIARDPDHALILGLGRHMDDPQADAGDHFFVAAGKGVGRGDEGARAGPLRRAETGAECAVFADWQAHAELIEGAPAENRRDQPDIAEDMTGEVLVAVYPDLAGGDVVFGNEGLGAAHMVGMEMGVDDRLDRLVGNLAELGGDFLGRFQGGHGIDQDNAVITLDHGAVGYRIGERHMVAPMYFIDASLHGRLMGGELGMDGRCLGVGGHGSVAEAVPGFVLGGIGGAHFLVGFTVVPIDENGDGDRQKENDSPEVTARTEQQDRHEGGAQNQQARKKGLNLLGDYARADLVGLLLFLNIKHDLIFRRPGYFRHL